MRRLHASIDGGRSQDPAEGRTDLDLPGADHGRPGGDRPAGDELPGAGGGAAPGSPETQRRDELADRVGTGSASPAGRDRADVLPDVEPPEEQA